MPRGLANARKETVILYHGTSTKHLDAILRSGLQPRRVTNRRSNWKGSLRSKPDFVYLKDAYPVYFAMNAALGSNGRGSDVVIIQVEVDGDQLFPDEDYVAWERANRRDDPSIRELIAQIDPADYQEHWRDSLERNGIVCTPAVRAEGILGHRIIARKNFGLLMAIGGDAMPIPLNYRFMGSHYRECVEVLFEHGEDAALETAASYWSLNVASSAHA